MEGTGQPAPEYKQNEFMVYATIRQHGDAVTTEKTTEKILSLILENPNITIEELARVCDMTPDGVYYHTKRLREKGVLIREGGRKEGHWIVVKKSCESTGYATIKWLTNGSQLHHLRFEIQGLEVKD